VAAPVSFTQILPNYKINKHQQVPMILRMIIPPVIRTERLELIPATSGILTADCSDRKELGRILDAIIPAGWPPALLDDATLAEFIRMQADNSDPNFCSWYWILAGPGDKGRILIGSGGTGSCPGEPDAVMIGYSVLDAFQRRGYATEALQGMIPVIFQYPGIRKIRATTYPNLIASIRVLEKNDFVPVGTISGGTGMEEGTLAFVLCMTEK
jgi:[ribosomal protein S5]-alanine N-acetyltransferase